MGEKEKERQRERRWQKKKKGKEEEKAEKGDSWKIRKSFFLLHCTKAHRILVPQTRD